MGSSVSPWAEAILESCRASLQATPFRFQHEWAEILPGAKVGRCRLTLWTLG